MAIQIPNSLYTAGNVALDSTPSVNFYRQIEAERRAKQDAIDDYMRGLRGKVTPAGMRVGDLPAFDSMRKKWQDFGIQNRDKIARDPQARSQFESMAQELMSFAEESKAEEAAKKPIVELFTDPAKREKVRPEVFTMIGEHDKPLYTVDESGNYVRDYGRKRLDYTSNLFKEPQFDFQKEYKGWVGDAKQSEVIELDKPYTDKQTGMVFFPSKEKYNKEQIAQVGRNAVRAVKDDENKLQYYADRMAGITQKEYEQLDNIYRKYYNEPIGTSPEKLAAAEAAAAAEQQTRDLKPVSKLDYERRQDDKRINIMLNQSSGGSAKPTVQWDLTEYNTESDGGKNLTVPFQGYTFTDILGAKFGAKKVVYYPDKKQFKVTEYTSRDNDGNPAGEKTKMVSAATLRQDIQGSNPQADMKAFDALINSPSPKSNVSQPGGTYTIKGKKYTLAELQKMDSRYTEQALEKYKDK